LEINPRLHHEYIEVSVDAIGYQAMIWHESMFSSPCRCCGAIDHGLLKLVHENDGRKTSGFACPITRQAHIVDMINEPRNDKKYMPCPESFAYHFGCQEGAILKALKSFDEYGAGKYLSGPEFQEFKTRALNTCEWYRSMNTFKREIIKDLGHDAEERMYVESEEEKPQDTRA